MITYSALAALLVAMIITLLSIGVFKRRGPWGSAWTLFLILFLALWTVSLYVRSLGPVYLGVSWFPLIIAGVILAFLLAAVLPDANHWRDESLKGGASDTLRESNSGRVTPADRGAKVGKAFWIVIIMLVVSIVIGMLNPQMAL